MKALKEKRISLRSLWRRGLVILSLFALVFASCSDSSSGGGSADSGGPRIVDIAVNANVTNDQFLGQPFDLTGLSVTVRYANGNVKEAKFADEPNNFTTIPRVVTGTYIDQAYADTGSESISTDWDFYGTRGYYVVYNNAETWYSLPSNIKVIPIFKTNSLFNLGLGDYFNVTGSYDLGIHVTGAETMKQRTAYVDDDTFDFSGLALEADYWVNWETVKDYPNNYVEVPEIVRKKISLADVTWEIVPRYDRAKKDAVGYYDGYVLITAGQDLSTSARDGIPTYDYSSSTELDIWNYNRKGLTAVLPLDAVYTVRDVNGINLIDYDTEAVSKYFFWEENTRASWLDRLGDNAKLQVTYTDNSTKTKWIKDLRQKASIYLNSNPDQGYVDNWTEEGVYNGPEDFDIMTVKYPITKKSGDLGVILYYRGGQYPITVSVYTTLVKVEATPAVNFWPDPTWDNDVDNGPGGPVELSKKIEVKALYSAINNAEDQEYKTLTYFWATDLSRPYKTGPFYLFSDNDEIDDDFESDEMEAGGAAYSGQSTYAKGYQKYLNNNLKNKETTTNVTVSHAVSVYTEAADTKYNHGKVWNSGTKKYEWSIDNTAAGGSLFSAGITNWYEKAFKDAWNNDATWHAHDRGMLPNGWSPYDPDQKKEPWGYIYSSTGLVVTNGVDTPKNNANVRQNPARDFGPKLNQSKKAKIAVTWIDHKE